nr:retrovirus-related Pol polyprotein from transposon TNT 1-94 [Tanacetum cinerariifolium]
MSQGRAGTDGLADDEFTVRKSHARNGKWVDITIRKVNTLLSMDEDADWKNYLKDELLSLKQAKLDTITFQIQNTELTKLNHALQEQLKEEKNINEKWLTSSKKVSQCISEQIPHQKEKVIEGYDQEMVPKTKYCVERLNPDSKLPNFNTERILAFESQAGASPSSEVMPLTFQPHSPKERLGLGTMKHTKPEIQDSSNKSVLGTVTVIGTKQITPSVHTKVKDTEQESKLKELTKLVQMLIDEKCNAYGSIVYSTSNHNEFDHFKRREKIQAAKAKEPTPRRNDVYVLDMSSLTLNGALFFAKASESINWLWHKRLSHLNFKNINKLSKQNKVLGLPYLVYSKDKPCTACEKGKHHRASFKLNKTSPSRSVCIFFIWTCLDQKKSQAPEMIMSFIRMEIIPDISYFHVFGCLVFIHNHKDYLGKFDVKADDGYFLGYSFVSKDFRVYNTRRQQIKETYHVTFDESMEAIKFTNTSVDEIGIDDFSRYPPDEFLHEDDLFRQYQVDFDFSYYAIPYGRSLTELTQENYVPEDNQMITQPTGVPSGNNTKVSRPITEPLVPDVTQSYIPDQASISSHPAPQDRLSRDQHIKHVNTIGNPREGMLTRGMATKLTAASASECLFADFLSEIEPKKVYKALKHPRWIDAMQEELNQFYKNKVWTLVPPSYGKIGIGSKWVFRTKKDEHGTTIKNKARLVAQGYSQKEEIDYDETFAPVLRMEAIRIFLAFATYMNFKVYQIDVKSAFLNGKAKEEVYVKKPPYFESSEFPDYVYKLDKALYGLKQAPRA